MKYAGLLILFFGLSALGYSFSMEPYTNGAEYNEKYMAIDRENIGRTESFEAFYELRDSYLTNKYMLMDYGITFISLGLFLSIILWKGWRKFRSPNKNWKIALIGTVAAF